VSLHAVVSFVAVFLLGASAGMMFFIARAPGWERVRLMAAIALSAALYSALDFWFYVRVDDLALRGAIVQANVAVAALHAALWLRFTFADATGAVRSMPRWAIWLGASTVLVATGAAAADRMLDRATVLHVQVPWLGLDERVHPLNALGDGLVVAVLLVLGVSLVQHVRRVRRGDRSALGIVVGLSLYAVCMIEEALVAAGAVEFMYLASPGYLFAVLPLTVQLLQRFADDARRLSELGTRLSAEVEARTSERDAARESLVEQQRLAALGRLAAGVGHEINNPLQYLVFHLEELRSTLGREAPPEVRVALRESIDGARRIGRVVTSLRTYGVRGEHFKRVKLVEVVRAGLRIASPQLRHRVQITSDLQPVPEVFGDEGQLVQMIVNPLVNAAQALQRRADGGDARIVVFTRTTANGDAELLVHDNGPGFDPAVLPRLGEPYVTTRASDGGTGLGLFVTRGLVAAHGGTLTLENAPGGGAQVRIVLPAAAADAADPDSGEVETPRVAVPSRVLVVDDEPVLLAVMQRALGRMGHTVTVAPDGEAALALVAREPFDIIVSDLMMPRMTGAALAEALAAQHPALRRRLVIMTGGAVTPEDESFLAREDILVLNKPISLAELAGVMVAVQARA
jgi:signal transduction histidine kinase